MSPHERPGVLVVATTLGLAVVSHVHPAVQILVKLVEEETAIFGSQ